VIQAGPIETPEAPAAVNRAANASILGPSHSQTSTGLIHDQGGAIGKTDANSSAVSQAGGAHQVEAGGTATLAAMWAKVDKLEGTFGSYLFNGIDASRKREIEKNYRRQELTQLTDTVRLHFPLQGFEDFKLEIWICSSVGESILQAKMRSVEDMRGILGDRLFMAMKSSNQRKQEEEMGVSDCTGAVNVFSSNPDHDCKVEVMLQFQAALDLHAAIFFS